MDFEAIVKGTSNKLYRKNVDMTRTKMVRVHKGIPSGWDGDNEYPEVYKAVLSTRVSHPDGTETKAFTLDISEPSQSTRVSHPDGTETNSFNAVTA